MAEFTQDENIPGNEGGFHQRSSLSSSVPTTDNNNSNSNNSNNNNVVSKNAHRRFATVANYVKELGGSKGRVIEKILIANNGVAAVKAIRSIRRWAYEVFGNEKAISFVVMATPEDLRANAEYIRMGDVIVDVPGGSNNHNYANVTLIVELARLHGVHAVWAGWGHASENPILPDTLAKSDPPIKFIGPSGPPMRALGDKIGSTIIAQSAGVPCIAWNGQAVRAVYDKENGSLPDEAYEQASVATASEALTAAEMVGFPIMIKASEGGGGKGIRRVDRSEDVANAYRQVCGEVPGSPIFIMKLSSNSRHLEVQLLADEYGDAIALNGRDCSVQRRHQKIIEEGPPVAALPQVWSHMEKAAVALAKAVSYANAGTVEYLYSEREAKFYFLELNPRLQVEHPVTEMITKVNLPAAQLQVAMGIPLQNIPEIRELYGRNRFEDEPTSPASAIDFSVAERLPPAAHCIAVRITAENAEAGFKPTSGGIQELNFRSTPNVWGYFSMDSSGSIHEFADSQFGHLFASGPNREDARRNMVLALKELSIRGDISTTVDYISKLIELEDFVANRIDTGWLDEIIKNNVDGLASSTLNSAVKDPTLHSHVYVVLGAAIKAFESCQDAESTFLDLLEKGQLPGRSLIKVKHNFELILGGIKYRLSTMRKGPSTFAIGVQGSSDEYVESNIRVLSDGGYLIAIGGNSHVAYLTNKGDAATGMRISVGGANVVFSPDYDPTSLRTDVAGKLVKKLKADGAHVKKGEPYCEVEVMKMFMPLKVEESGIISWCANEGASLSPGNLLAKLELDNPENVSSVLVYDGHLKVPSGSGASTASMSKARPHLVLRAALEKIGSAMSGYMLTGYEVEKAFNDIASSVISPMLPTYEVEEQISVLSGRIPPGLFKSISSLLSEFKHNCEAQAGSGVETRFPAEQILSLIVECANSLMEPAERSSFEGLTMSLRESVIPYAKSSVAGVPGSERALVGFLELLRKWINVERWFCDKPSHADAVDLLRKSHKSDFRAVLDICRSHEHLPASCEIVTRLLSIIGDGFLVDFRSTDVSAIGKRVSMVAGAGSLSLAMPAVAEIGSMGTSSAYSEVALRARKLLLQESMPSLEQRRQKVLAAAADLSKGSDVGGLDAPRNVQELLSDHIPMADVLFPLLKAKAETKESVGLLELYVRHVYRPFSLKEFVRDFDNQLVQFSFYNKPSEGALNTAMSVTSMTDLSRAASSGSLSTMISDKSDERNDEKRSSASEKIPLTTQRTGIFAALRSLSDLENEDKIRSILSRIPQFTGKAPKCDAGGINVLYFVVLAGSETKDEGVLASQCSALVEPIKALLETADVRRVSFIFDPESTDDMNDQIPNLFTFRYPDFKEDSLYRRIDPSLAAHLELNRVASNFSIRSLGSRHTPTCHAHLYEAKPKSAALAKDTKANKAARIFARALSFSLEFSASGFERILVDALNALDLCSVKNSTDNHLFLNLVSDFENSVLDPVVVEEIVATVLKRHGERVLNLGIAEVETRIVCCLSLSTPPIALRLFASNPTGYVLVMNTYVEAAGEGGSDRVFKLIGGTKASLASTGDSSWDGLNVRTPYPLTRPFDAQRKAAARSSDSVYCYDLPALFEAAVEQQWQEESAKAGTSGVRNASRPHMVMYTTELVVKKRFDRGTSWTMQDYLDGGLELAQETRGAGANDVGMVAWLVELKTVEYPNGRQVVLIANDITFKAGSFGTREDVVFKLASEFARDHRIPRLFIAANSGARIGLADKVKKKFKVAFKDPTKPENGFEFLYVEKEDYDFFTSGAKAELKAEPIDHEGRQVYKITDVIGSEPDLGVENLKGSGLIAGETSRANEDIFTLTVVLGRTVGIGAYLVRLGQRTIQKSSASPIILTGYQALNKLMGVEVYSTNDQLGGPGIMYPNGISHQVETDHLRAIKSAIDWLSYVPSHRRGLLPITDIRGLDSVDRQITFTPKQGVPYDPRSLLAGCEDDNGLWQGGFFDRGSFTESLAGWAKTVVVGRARLGGIPMGVIITENRTAEAVKPADPADVKAAESVIQEAGCVWFPNSAYKTAQAIKDFRTEDLPLIVFANWRGFSGGQRDMFDEVLKYGSLIVDAFCSYEQPVFVFIPPFAEIRGGAWVVLDASINSAVMEMYAASGSARGGVLEANGAASVKYRTKDLIATMHRLDDKLIALDEKLSSSSESTKTGLLEEVSARENALLPVYEQIAVQFCELHDTPGRMKAVGVIRAEVDWPEARSFFYWRLRRQLAIFDLRRQLQEAASVGRGVRALTPESAGNLVRDWFMETRPKAQWEDDKAVLEWMAREYTSLEDKIRRYASGVVAQEVVHVMTAGGQTAKVGINGILEGLELAIKRLSSDDRENIKSRLALIMKK